MLILKVSCFVCWEGWERLIGCGCIELEEAGVDLDGDWDPEEHDQQMAGLYARQDKSAGSDGDDGDDEDEVGEEVEEIEVCSRTISVKWTDFRYRKRNPHGTTILTLTISSLHHPMIPILLRQRRRKRRRKIKRRKRSMMRMQKGVWI